MSNRKALRIGLALSGGGFRAAVFHLGVLRRLAECGRLEDIEAVSSVSGGSLLTGLIFHCADNAWPTSTRFLDETLPKVRDVFLTRSLQDDALWRLLAIPSNWRFALSRAAVVAQTIEKTWGISGTIDQLPARPIWSINGTTAENGRRFRFKGKTGGDYELGYADFSGFKIASAMAMSAAFPGGIGPLPIDPLQWNWRKRDGWNATTEIPVTLPYRKLHLYDGGIYDNLGLEPFFDMGKQDIKRTEAPVDFLIVSDAGRPFQRGKIPSAIHWRRFERITEVVMDQARSLRVRAFSNFLRTNANAGLYLQIGSSAADQLKSYSKSEPGADWLNLADVQRCSGYRTQLKKFSQADCELLMRHGYETTRWNEIAFAQGVLHAGV